MKYVLDAAIHILEEFIVAQFVISGSCSEHTHSFEGLWARVLREVVALVVDEAVVADQL